MAPIESATRIAQAQTKEKEGLLTLDERDKKEYKYAHLLPTFPDDKYPPLTPFEHVDPGSRALSHPNPRAFLDGATTVIQVTPALGTEVRGVDLLKLDSNGRDQLALETAKRGFIVFRGQNGFIDKDVEYWREWGRHFGRLHVHPTSGHPAGAPEIHLVYRSGEKTWNYEPEERTTSTVWHSDVSYERQPPGLTTFFLLDAPETGGDTLFVSQVAALKRLSPLFVGFLKTLKAVHSGQMQAAWSRAGKRGGVVRREPVEHVHPVVRRHPVTGEEALYVNQQFTTKIVGLKKEESDNLLGFLYDHLAKGGDSQARIKYEPGTVVVWDNRVTAHSANVDYAEEGVRRHGARITPQAEKPLPALDGLDLGQE